LSYRSSWWWCERMFHFLFPIVESWKLQKKEWNRFLFKSIQKLFIYLCVSMCETYYDYRTKTKKASRFYCQKLPKKDEDNFSETNWYENTLKVDRGQKAQSTVHLNPLRSFLKSFIAIDISGCTSGCSGT
jgi:hypothetical protein